MSPLLDLRAAWLPMAASVLLATSATSRVQAELPTLEGAATPVTRIYNTTRSVVLGDRVDSQRAYVLPPETAWVVPESFQPSANLGLCQEMERLRQVSREVAAQLAQPQLLNRSFETSIEALRTARVAALREREESAYFADLRSSADRLEEQSWDLEDEIAAATDRCHHDEWGQAECARLEALLAELDMLIPYIHSLRSDANALQARNGGAVRELARIDASILDLEQRASQQLQQLAALFDQTFELYQQYAVLVGGTATIRLDSGWDESLVTLATDNPSLRFEPIVTRAAQVRAGLIPGIGTDSYFGTLPAVVAYRVNGVAGEDDLMFPLAAYPQSMEVQLDLSLTGACPVAYPDRYDLERLAGLPIFGVTTVYEHDVASPFDVTVSYQGHQVLQAIRRPGRRLMLVPSVLEAARPFVTITWHQSPPALPSQRQRVEDQLVSEAVDRVLALAGTVHHDWNGPDVWRPFLAMDGPSLPASTVRVVGRLAPMTNTQVYDAVLERAAVAPAVPTPAPSPVKGLPTRPGAASQKPGFAPPTPAETRVTHSATLVYERAAFPVCGYDQLRCDGTGWGLPRDLGARTYARLNRTFTYRRSPHFLTPRLAMSTFNTFGRPTHPPTYVGAFGQVRGCIVPIGQSSCEALLTYQTNSTRACVYERATKLGCSPAEVRPRLTVGDHVLVLRSGPSEHAKALATTVLTISFPSVAVQQCRASSNSFCNNCRGCSACVEGVFSCDALQAKDDPVALCKVAAQRMCYSCNGRPECYTQCQSRQAECDTLARASDFALRHAGGSCVHPSGGSPNPAQGTPAIFYPLCEDGPRLRFRMLPNRSIQQVSSGKCLQPEGSAAPPAIGTRLVYGDQCSDGYLADSYGNSRFAFEFTASGSLRHASSGLCVHPSGGSATPTPGTELLLWAGCDEPRLTFERL